LSRNISINILHKEDDIDDDDDNNNNNNNNGTAANDLPNRQYEIHTLRKCAQLEMD